MADEVSTKSPSSMSIRKAISKNQTFDRELKKELHCLDLKKKTSEKAFEYRKNQFIRKRLCLNHLVKSEGSIHDAILIRQRRLGTREHQDVPFPSSGKLLANIQTQNTTPSLVENLEEIGKKNSHKLSLDYSNFYKNSDGTKLFGTKIEKSHSWSEDLSAKDFDKVVKVENESITSKSLQIPPLPMFFRSQSAETLYKTNKANNTEEVNESDQQNNNKSSSHLCAPMLHKRFSRSAEHLPMTAGARGASNANRSLRPEVPRIERQHSYCEERRSRFFHTSETELSTCLVLPPLTRQRSKSVEIHDKRVVGRMHANSENPNLSRQPKPPSSQRNEKAKARRKTSPFCEKAKEERDKNTNDNESHERKIRRRSLSTPDLFDLGSEVEYLLMDDDQTRLQRMRAAVRSMSFAENVEECRYIRNFNAFDHHKNDEQAKEEQTSSDVPLPVITPNPSIPKHCNKKEINQDDQCSCLEELQNAHSGDSINNDAADLSRDSDEPIGQLDGSLGSSSQSSTLAEMFEEIKKTRYLRIPGGSAGDDDDDVDVLMTSHGYNTPMIIVGCTKSVLMDDNTL